jgi:putative peptide zinc metalloprotease protein
MVSRQWDAFLATFPYFFSLSGMLLYGLVLAAVKCAHELGHALVAKHFGLRVPTMGIAFLVLWPVLYTDTTEAWKLRSRGQRLLVTAAGMATELALAGLAALAWCFLPDGPARSVAFVVASVTSVLTLVVNLNPFMRFDGYYLLADWLDEPNLQPRSFMLARWWLRRVFVGSDEPVPENLPLPRLRLLVAYALATWCYRAVVMVAIALMLYFLFWKPLGLFLMLVELWVFVLGPVWRELRQWWQLARGQALNPAQRRSLVLLGGVVLLLVVPWQQEITRTAVLRPAEYARVYAPEAGRIVSVAVREGQYVSPAQELLRADSPELDYEWGRALGEVAALQHQLMRSAPIAGLREFSEVMAGRLSEARAVARSVGERRERLTLSAPAAARVVDLDETLQSGQWIARGQPLMMLVADQRQLIETFVRERELPRIVVGAGARFHANEDNGDSVRARVVSVDRASTAVLPEPWFADRYGGDVPTRNGKDGELESHEAIYRVLLEPSASAPLLPRMLPGFVVIDAERRSALGAAADSVVAVFRREAGI